MNLCVQKIPNHIVLMQLLHFSHTFKWVFLWSLIRFNIVYYRKNLINPLLLKHKKLLKKSRVRETARMNVFSYFCDASCSVIAAKVTLHECVIWWMFWVGGTFVIKPVFLLPFWYDSRKLRQNEKVTSSQIKSLCTLTKFTSPRYTIPVIFYMTQKVEGLQRQTMKIIIDLISWFCLTYKEGCK